MTHFYNSSPWAHAAVTNGKQGAWRTYSKLATWDMIDDPQGACKTLLKYMQEKQNDLEDDSGFVVTDSRNDVLGNDYEGAEVKGKRWEDVVMVQIERKFRNPDWQEGKEYLLELEAGRLYYAIVNF